jgi:hypothetical protein
MKLVFATLMRCSDRWNWVSISDLERRQLRSLRCGLGVDPPPTKVTRAPPKRKRAA